MLTHADVDTCRRYQGQPAEDEAGSSAAAAANGPGPSSGAGSSRAAAARSGGGRGGKRARPNTRAAAGAAAGEADDDEIDPVTGELVREQGYWKCKHCTVNNQDLAANTCEVCGLPRPE